MVRDPDTAAAAAAAAAGYDNSSTDGIGSASIATVRLLSHIPSIDSVDESDAMLIYSTSKIDYIIVANLLSPKDFLNILGF